MFLMPTPSPFLLPSTISLASTNTGTGGTVTMPADVATGDVIIVCHGAASASPSKHADFTTLASAGNTNGIFTDSGGIISYRISDGTEGSQSYAGWSGASDASWVVSVWRPDVPASTLTPQDTASYAGTGNPAGNTMGVSAASAPTVAVYMIWDSGASPPADFGTFSGDGNDPVTGSTQLSVGAIISYQHTQGAGGFDITADIHDIGVQASMSGYLEVT